MNKVQLYYHGFVDTCASFGIQKEAADYLYKYAGIRDLLLLPGLGLRSMRSAATRGAGLLKRYRAGGVFNKAERAELNKYLLAQLRKQKPLSIPAPVARGAVPAPVARGAVPAPVARGAAPAPAAPAAANRTAPTGTVTGGATTNRVPTSAAAGGTATSEAATGGGRIPPQVTPEDIMSGRIPSARPPGGNMVGGVNPIGNGMSMADFLAQHPWMTLGGVGLGGYVLGRSTAPSMR